MPYVKEPYVKESSDERVGINVMYAQSSIYTPATLVDLIT